MSDGPPADPDVLVIEGKTPSKTALWVTRLGVFGLMLASCGAFEFLPWERAAPIPGYLGWLARFGPFGGIAVAFVALLWFEHRVSRLQARAELSASGVSIVCRGEGVAIAWSEIASYDDTSEERVRLFGTAGPVPANLWTIPTVTEEARTRVLAALDAHGIRRLERA